MIPKPEGHSSQYVLSGETVLYHEYAHHFMIAGLTARAFPRWFTEGFAEFFAGVRFEKDGSVLLGTPAQPSSGGADFCRGGPDPQPAHVRWRRRRIEEAL